MDLAENENLLLFSITDHDTIQGTKIAKNIADNYSLKYITGIEISARFERKKIEILGYNFDIRNKLLKSKLTKLQNARKERVSKILAKLCDISMKISLEELMQHVGTAQSPGRPHFARAMVAKGYAKTIKEAFNEYLNEGKPAYVPRETILPHEAIEIIHGAKGTAILPHPLYVEAYDMKKLEEILDLLLEWNLEGIEVYYNYYHTDFKVLPNDINKATKFLIKYCKTNDLLMTGGTDFHGDSGRLGEIPVPKTVINQLLEFFSV